MKKALTNKENFVRFDADELLSRPLTSRQKEELKALAARPENEIDYSDIPPLTEEFWKNAVRGKFYRPNKVSTTVRIDADVLAWLRKQGAGYQTKINAILRKEMLHTLGK